MRNVAYAPGYGYITIRNSMPEIVLYEKEYEKNDKEYRNVDKYPKKYQYKATEIPFVPSNVKFNDIGVPQNIKSNHIGEGLNIANRKKIMKKMKLVKSGKN